MVKKTKVRGSLELSGVGRKWENFRLTIELPPPKKGRRWVEGSAYGGLANVWISGPRTAVVVIRRKKEGV